MASFYKSQGQSLISGVDTVELERALHNLEFEKKQQIQEFEKEKQQIAILEKSTNEKQDGIKRMEEDVSRIDEEIKSSHRQFRQNKELLKESQKAHSSVLNFHLEAKKKEIQQLTEKYEIENADLQSKLDHYDTVWKSYEEVYMQQENAKELMKWQLEVLQCKEAVKEGRLQISNLQQGEDELQEEILANESPFQSITDFVIRFAEIKVSTRAKQFETEQLLNSISAAEKDIQTLQETQAEIIKNIEEKRKEEELERQRIEKEKEQKEKALQEEYARKKKEEQQNSANSRPGVYKFGQFLHHAPTSNQPPASRLPSTTKRNALPKPHPPTPRTPLLIPATSNYSRPPSRSFTTQGSGVTSVGGQVGPTPTSEALPSSDKFFINVPPRSPVIGERGSRRPAPVSYLGNRGGRSQQQSCKAAQVMSSSGALADTMYNMNIQTPARPSTHAKPQGQVAPVAPHQSATLETRRGGSSEPAMGPGGDAQPNPISSEDQLPCQGDIEMSGSSLEMMEANPQEDMQNVQEYPLTPKCSQDRDKTEGPKTPKTPGDTFDLGTFKDFGNSKSPGFSYSCRAMFGDSADQNQAEQTSNNNFQENPFFSSFFGASSKFTDQQTSQSPGDMFGGGGNTQANSNTNQDAGAMSMFGDSPSSTQPNQARQEPESMGFSFNFGSSSPSQTPAGGDSESGGGRSGGFCLF